MPSTVAWVILAAQAVLLVVLLVVRWRFRRRTKRMDEGIAFCWQALLFHLRHDPENQLAAEYEREWLR